MSKERRAILILEDGEVFEGVAFGASRDALGEVVFNTGMTGYQEVLTDPSYAGQIVTMTYPHVGNYGVNEADVESPRPQVAGFVIRDLPVAWSSWRGERSIEEYLRDANVTGITEVDTRRLTRHLRSRGAMRGGISSEVLDPQKLRKEVLDSPQMVGLDLVGEVTTEEPYVWPRGPEDPKPSFKVAAYDFGMKHNILRLLSAHRCEVTVFNATTPPSEILSGSFDGVFLSNGPGDPDAVKYGIEAARSLLGQIPLFGICLGHQLVGLALGLKTFKLPFGHRGINHPVARLADGAVEITTQNHGFAVAHERFGFERPERPGAPLPSGARTDTPFGEVELTHLNLNDYTVEGFRLIDQPAFCVQYHPEAGPGPHDSRYLFEQFIELMGGGGDGAR